MEKQRIIAISREYGSGGRALATELSKRFDLPLYDRNLLTELMESKDLDPAEVQQYDERPRKPILTRTVTIRGGINLTSSNEENIAHMQFRYLKQKAEAGESFIVLGRCAEWVLRDYEGLISFFVLADMEWKIKYLMETKDLSRYSAIAKIQRHDYSRKQYHNRHCDIKWGDSRGYNLCINSGKLGLDKTADYLEYYIRNLDAEK